MPNQADRDNVLPSFFTLVSAGLYERSGFEGGELFDDAFPQLSAVQARELLAAVVQSYLLPALENEVQTVVIPGVHNPIRATHVDGTSVQWSTAERGIGPALVPASVRVQTQDVLECARRLRLGLPSASAA